MCIKILHTNPLYSIRIVILCSFNSPLRNNKKSLIPDHEILETEMFDSLSMENAKKLVSCHTFNALYLKYIAY